MKNEGKKFLEFNGKVIYFVAADGQYWIALKPICEALGIGWKYQHEKLQKDKILGQLSRDHGMVAADGKIREMTSLPEFAIYGWIFKIESNAEGLEEYQWECYRVLYEHFHGMIGGRKDLLKQKAEAQLEIDRIYNSFSPEQALALSKANKRINAINSELRKLDAQVMDEERDLFNSTN